MLNSETTNNKNVYSIPLKRQETVEMQKQAQSSYRVQWILVRKSSRRQEPRLQLL